MKQIWPNYSYSPTTNVLTLTGLNIDRDQLLLVSAPERGRIMYNFADSATTASAFTAGANTGLTLVASTAGLTTTAALVIYYDDQLQSTAITVSSLPAISGTVTVGNISSLPDADGNRVSRNFVFGYNYATELPVAVAINGTSLSVTGTVTANVPLSVDGYSAVTGIRVMGCGSDGGLRVQGIDPSNFNPANLEEGGAIPIFSVNNNALPISGTVTASLAISSTAITSGSFTSLTSATLVPGNVARKMATVYNLGAGQLFVNAGVTATTLGGGFMVALSSGDYFECDYTTTTLSAIFASAGTASWVSH